MLLSAIYRDLDVGVPTLLTVSRKGDHSSFIADITIPHGGMVLAGQKFEKTWVIQNTGAVTPIRRKLKFYDSELFTAKSVSRAGKRFLEEDISPGYETQQTNGCDSRNTVRRIGYDRRGVQSATAPLRRNFAIENRGSTRCDVFS